MFNSSKYTTWYHAIIAKAKMEGREGYVERHHIVPKSLGGSNRKENLVKLSPREHYVVHLLLMKMVDDLRSKYKMAAAFLYMSKVRNGNTEQRYSSRLYEYHKKIRAKVLKESNAGSGNPMHGRNHSDATRAKISKARLGINTNTAEGIEKKRKNWLLNNPNNDPEVKLKQKAALYKDYVIQNPDGEIITVHGLKEFCKERKISAGNLLTHGHTKGYKLLERVT